jgi:hypothetical protein
MFDKAKRSFEVLRSRGRRFSGGSAYLTFAGFFEDGGQLILEAFGENHKRLVVLKNDYDPTNLFHLHQNIKPTA